MLRLALMKFNLNGSILPPETLLTISILSELTTESGVSFNVERKIEDLEIKPNKEPMKSSSF